MKLYATLETSKGKVVSVSDNSEITATLYDGNMKAYSVTISWTNVGDPDHIRCNHCDWKGDESNVYTKEIGEEMCPNCKKGDALMDIPAEYGAIVQSREWRNRPETNDRQGINKCSHKKTEKTVHGKYCLDCHAYL